MPEDVGVVGLEEVEEEEGGFVDCVEEEKDRDD